MRKHCKQKKPSELFSQPETSTNQKKGFGEPIMSSFWFPNNKQLNLLAYVRHMQLMRQRWRSWSERMSTMMPFALGTTECSEPSMDYGWDESLVSK